MLDILFISGFIWRAVVVKLGIEKVGLITQSVALCLGQVCLGQVSQLQRQRAEAQLRDIDCAMAMTTRWPALTNNPLKGRATCSSHRSPHTHSHHSAQHKTASMFTLCSTVQPYTIPTPRYLRHRAISFIHPNYRACNAPSPLLHDGWPSPPPQSPPAKARRLKDARTRPNNTAVLPF